ncbi:MAG TPA: RIP metalloprotease RseP [Gemmatimonadaceae bacterium]|jgi:regulator of sigma E protease|nr:RIP metalloprotease RseP [Gemmatimonadaceae bacterium]
MNHFWDVLRDHVPWLAPILVFGVVIFVHELGHFLAAKITGVYAPRFSIGFGSALWHHRWGETEYRLAVLPLGGYVRMASRDDESMAMIEGGGETGPEVHGPDWDPNALKPFGPKPVPEDRWFESKPLWARLFIMLAGVTMNIVLAYVVLAGVFAHYGKPSGVQTPIVDSVVTNMPAAAAGLIAHDSVVAVGGVPVHTALEAQEQLRPAIGKALTIDVVRSGKPLSFTVTPVAAQDTDAQTHAVRTIGRVGVLFRPEPMVPVPLPQAAALAGEKTVELFEAIVESVGKLVTGQVSIKTLSGPVGIAKYSVQAARSGLENLLLLLAVISVNLAVLNLLPIPILDGGQIVVNVVESIRGTPLTLRTRELILRAGLLAIAFLFVVVMYNDRCVFFSALCS